ncbi:major facilitator superfamily domain-containing protein [Scleroderma yunnanense]
MTIDENAPLLSVRRVKTPLPRVQLAVVLLVLFVEPITAQYMIPFINQLICEIGITGGDDRKIGYYAGLIDSAFYLSQALTTLHWSCLSDYIGRKPVILFGLIAVSISNVCFGLSKTFWALVVSRCIAGALNGNLGIMKSVMGDITDYTNMAQGFALIPCILATGTAIGPFYGGTLVKPHDHWPKLFSGTFWKRYPYFLPCIISALLAAAVFVTAALFLEESRPPKQSKRCSQSKVSARDPQNGITDEDTSPTPIHTLMKTYSVMVPIATYGTLTLVDVGHFALLPLFYATPIEIGGLGLSPSVIGVYLAVFGLVDGLFQALFVTKLIDNFGGKKVFRTTILVLFPLIVVLPFMNFVVQSQKRVGLVIWMLMTVQLMLLVMIDTAYAVIFMFITNASPNKHSLGAINGLGQTMMLMAKAIGPAAFTSLFAFSKQLDLLGGNLVYVVLGSLACFLVFLSNLLPELDIKGEKGGQDIARETLLHSVA